MEVRFIGAPLRGFRINLTPVGLEGTGGLMPQSARSPVKSSQAALAIKLKLIEFCVLNFKHKNTSESQSMSHFGFSSVLFRKACCNGIQGWYSV